MSASQSERACLERLSAMDRSLAEMEPQLPEDMKPLGAEARLRVSLWLGKLAQGGADLESLATAMAELTLMMDALTARLLLQPWDARTSRS
jgi:hypothetical protein